jgi:tetratricopeptide (TPR) repeat protein
VGKASSKPISPPERQALSRVKSGGWVLAFIPLAGSLLGQFGALFQTSPMHPIYYAIAGIGILMTLNGVTTLKERYSYYSVFEFGLLLLLFHPLPALLPVLGPVFLNAYWFETTFLFLAVGFILMAFALRRMRAGQYEALEAEMRAGDQALSAGQFDGAIARYDRAVTISHSLFSDKLFKATRTGQRALPPDYYQPWVGKATALARSGRGAKALAILDLILEVDSSNPALWLNKGDVLLTLNRPAEAYIAYEQAQRASPQSPEAAQKKQAALDRLQRRIE